MTLEQRISTLVLAGDKLVEEDLSVIKLLVEYGANIDEKMPDGSTALTKARERGDQEIIVFLQDALKNTKTSEKISERPPL